MQIRDKSIFISRTSNDVPELSRLTQDKGINLIATSLIDFKPVDFKVHDWYDVIFFSSPRSFQFYLMNHDILEGQVIAVVGKATARVVRKAGYSIGFAGDDNKSVSENALLFKSWLVERSALFPISDRSLKTFSTQLPNKQKEEVIVYKTILQSKKIPECTVYIFSSPSNAEAFFKVNSIPANATVVAWGESTQKSLHLHGINALIPKEPSEQSVLQLLKSLRIL